MGEIGAQEQRALFRKCVPAREIGANLLKAALEKFVSSGLRVAIAELSAHLVPQVLDLTFRKRHNAGAYAQSALTRCARHNAGRVVGKQEWPKQHPRAVRVQNDLGALDSRGLHW
jgi:hypothetical protein